MKWIITLFTNNNLSIEYPEVTYHIWDIIMSIFFKYLLLKKFKVGKELSKLF